MFEVIPRVITAVLLVLMLTPLIVVFLYFVVKAVTFSYYTAKHQAEKFNRKEE